MSIQQGELTSDESEAGAPVVRRSGRTRREPQWFNCYEMSAGLALCTANFVDNVLDDRTGGQGTEWLAAVGSDDCMQN